MIIVDPLTLSSTLSAISEEKNLTYLLDPIEWNHNISAEKLEEIVTLIREKNLRYQNKYSRQQGENATPVLKASQKTENAKHYPKTHVS
ncbi:uncharacterized protein J4E87_002572 [Alternaria ethzedia]|uniref:uncharacterized protein n=1 Tax=Alternaria ethzedia TaxID=181014 RepID=UPI0020C2B7A5|nr:uncharacterized protein J4E87_002572 [Alternaria ethzedia]KAI4631865.1 hypothetical protein J4E87_002572 [Alternaria ethzedia]